MHTAVGTAVCAELLTETSNFAQQRMHLLSNGSDMPQGTVPPPAALRAMDPLR